MVIVTEVTISIDDFRFKIVDLRCSSMPLPLGHTAVGLAVHDIYSKSNNSGHLWKTLTFIIVLTNLPDMDVLIGLAVNGNGNFFHRGPTHSFLFALFIAFIASNGWRCWSKIPRISPLLCFLLVLSHVVADALLTNSPVSFWWPLELNLSDGHSSWREIIESVLFGAFRDLGTIVVSGLVIFLNRLIRNRPIPIPVILSRLVKGR